MGRRGSARPAAPPASGLKEKLPETRIPNGLPPVPLRGKISDEAILAWAQGTRVAWKERGNFLLIEGILYFLRNYFIDELDHPRAFARAEKCIRANLSDEQ